MGVPDNTGGCDGEEEHGERAKHLGGCSEDVSTHMYISEVMFSVCA